jgi:hypothetical protein
VADHDLERTDRASSGAGAGLHIVFTNHMITAAYPQPTRSPSGLMIRVNTRMAAANQLVGHLPNSAVSSINGVIFVF